MIETKEEGVKKLGDAFDEFQRAAYSTNMMCMKGHDFINADIAINEHVTYLYDRLVREASRQWDNGMNLFDSYIREIKKGTTDVVESMEGLKALMDHPDTLSNVAGGAIGLAQIAGGAAMFSGGVPTIGMGGAGVPAIVVGLASMAHGASNVHESVVGLYAVFTQDETINTNGFARRFYMGVFESFGEHPELGSMAYSSIDVALSAASIGARLHFIRTLADGSRNLVLFRVSRFDFERGFRLMKAKDAGIELAGAGLNARRFLQDKDALSKKESK